MQLYTYDHCRKKLTRECAKSGVVSALLVLFVLHLEVQYVLTVCSGTVNWEMLTGYHKGQYRYIKDFVATKNSATKTNHESSFDS